MMLEGMKSRWSDYRRGLRYQDQPHFDQLFEYADAHADASGYLNPDEPFHPVLISMLLEQEKRIAELEAELDEVDQIDAVQD